MLAKLAKAENCRRRSLKLIDPIDCVVIAFACHETRTTRLFIQRSLRAISTGLDTVLCKGRVGAVQRHNECFTSDVKRRVPKLNNITRERLPPQRRSYSVEAIRNKKRLSWCRLTSSRRAGRTAIVRCVRYTRTKGLQKPRLEM